VKSEVARVEELEAEAADAASKPSVSPVPSVAHHL